MSGMFGGNTPTPPVVPSVQYPNTSGAATNAFNDITGLGSFSLGNLLPQISNLAGSTAGAVGGPQGQFATNVAGSIAPALVGGGIGSMGAGATLENAATGMLGPIGSILQNSFDPQNALYARNLSNVTNQTGNALANAGVGTTPYGQSVLGNTLNNFNIDWQNNLLNREATGLGAATSALTGAGGVAGAGAGLESAGGELAAGGGMLPFSTLSALNQGGMGALTGAIGAGNTAAQVPQTAIGDWLNYLTGAQSSVNSANSANLASAEFTAQQQQQQFNNIASAFGGLGSSLGGLFGANGMFGAGQLGGAFGPFGAFAMV